MPVWWVLLNKTGTVRLLSEHTQPSVIIEAVSAAQTVWEVSDAQSAWDALSRTVANLSRTHTEKPATPHLRTALVRYMLSEQRGNEP